MNKWEGLVEGEAVDPRIECSAVLLPFVGGAVGKSPTVML